MEAREKNFVIADFKAGEFLAAVCDRKSYIGDVSNTDSHVLMSYIKQTGFKQWNWPWNPDYLSIQWEDLIAQSVYQTP